MLEYAERMGFDALGVKRAPSERLRHDAVAQLMAAAARAPYDERHAPRPRNSIACTIRRRASRGDGAMLDVISVAADRRLPGGHLHGHQLLLRPETR